MKQKLAQAVVEFLSFSKDASDRVHFGQFSQRDWQRTLPWLHDTGLALYFLQKLKDTNASAAVLPSVLFGLEQNLAANRQRVARLATQFGLLNRKFDEAGVLYAAVKGFSLIPEFCPDSCLRHQSDFDYLVQDEWLPTAQRVLEDAGYSLSMHVAKDYVFCLPPAGFVPSVNNQYSPEAPHTVELHLSLWDSNSRDIFLAQPRFSVDRTINRQWEGLEFRGLREEDLFLFQVTHAFHHISNYWLRLSWLYEMGYFLNRQTTEAPLWARLAHYIGEDPVLHEVIGLIATLASQFFAAPLPPMLETWILRPSVRVWIHNYSRIWAFGKNQVDDFSFLPTAKLTLFLLQHYVPDVRRFIWSRLLPSARLFKIARNLKTEPRRALDKQFRRRERVLSRAFFHVTANLRYICERPRWRRLNRIAARPLAT